MEKASSSPAFLWRRLHSLTGLWLVLFLIEHFLVNSQAALFLGEDGEGFVRSVTEIKELPYLPLIEIFLLGVPFLTHIILGIRYLRTSRLNSISFQGSKPSFPEYSRNWAYTLQRITSWVLLFFLVFHVVQMRFIHYPKEASVQTEEGLVHHYLVSLNHDQGLFSLSKRLGVKLKQENAERVTAQSPNFGTAELLMVRETFKDPWMIAFYTLFVLAASFHAFNGLWTFMITWGVTLTERSQKFFLNVAYVFMILVAFLGLSAVWMTYFVNLKQ